MTIATTTVSARDTHFRPARREDARTIAEFYRIASDGVSDYVWSKLADPGEDLLEVGARRYARENTEFSYQNCELAEMDGAVVGMLLGYRMPAPEPSDEPVDDPILAGLSQLEIPGSFYIAGIAVSPALRSAGIGSALMARAHDRARAGGMSQTSLIAFDPNPAVRLYERLAYRTVDRRPVVAHPLIRYTDCDALLMAVDL
ncbi:MAG TPA: GNAT family N-acetyltransferase [Alphaproteobacteria bacterium]|nr:GNAT family N-acetyltransferase [Alphaproteobacteria bacterium]